MESRIPTLKVKYKNCEEIIKSSRNRLEINYRTAAREQEKSLLVVVWGTIILDTNPTHGTNF